MRQFGFYGYAMLSSPTFAHFMTVAKRVFRAIYDVLDLGVKVERGMVVFTYDAQLPARIGYVPLMEQVLATGLAGLGSMADQVRRLLVYSPSNRVPTLPEVAARCHVAERTLRHRLAAEGVSFRQLVNDVRLALAKRYLLETDLSAQEVAYLLGYSQTQNFYRAFGKALGVPPEQYRRNQG